MKSAWFRYCSQSLLAVIVLLGSAGCPETASSNRSLPNPEAQVNAVVLEASPLESSLDPDVMAQVEGAIAPQICREPADWQRPSESEQWAQLRANPRYGDAIDQEPLKGMAEKFWQHQVVSFTTYGLSARLEPLYFSGLWPVEEAIWDCYNNTAPEAINAGQLADVWLMNYRLESLEWRDDQYVMVVAPTDRGAEVVQFARRETAAELPLKVVDAAGQVISVLSGDW